GTGTYTYQWTLNGEPISGANDRCLRVETPDWVNDQYCVVVSSDCGTTTKCVTSPCESGTSPGLMSTADSEPATLQIRAADGSIVLEAVLETGATYRVEGSNDELEWFEVGTVRADADGTFRFEPTTDQPAKFLRVVEEAPLAPRSAQ
ncbi:MAG: hypothetical protein IT580_09330, partial [Verrucomicrobiales bacterium]|nr:hypothetical protein [Verrucomicrobiales bacterium]